MTDRQFIKHIIKMERRLKLSALDLNEKEDFRNLQLMRNNRRGIRYAERHERIRQQYFRIFPAAKTPRGNKFANISIVITMKETAIDIGIKGWMVGTMDDPMGVHGVLEGTKTQFNRMIDFLQDWEDEGEIYHYIRKKPGYIKDYTFDQLEYHYHPYTYDTSGQEEEIYGLFEGNLRLP